MKKIPVFCINGFLEAGKTTFILSTIRRDGFYTRGKTLLIACEEGEVEYDIDELAHYNVDLVLIDNQQDINSDYLNQLVKKYPPDRIVMEMNIMWKLEQMSFPHYFEISQMITIIDGSTFPTYFQNMRQLFQDIIKESDVVAFNKLKNKETIAPFQTPLRLINSNCLYCIIDENCISTEQAFETPLPYDIEDEEIVLNDEDFGVFYIDTFDNRQKYEGKIVTFNAWVILSKKIEKNQFIAGRKVMTCCDNDIQLYGFLVNSNLGIKLKNDSWVKLKAKCHIEYNAQYNEEEIVLYPLEIDVIKPIKNQILDLR